ncbi:hypothetical protein [Sporosarcina sp.]|uniref:hypothetical protein n=1 Tax=Sporosarcina sp. TaxID=49982 RepID=UPI0026179930|nr:hypothetical protein [Sporosarcina sp.]
MNWQPYLSLMAKRPTAMKYSSFYDQLLEEWKAYIEACSLEEKKAALSLLSVLLKGQDFQLPTEALKMASEHGHPSAETIKHVNYQLVNGRGIRETLSLPRLPQQLPLTETVTRGLSHYTDCFHR